jgi:hypothetical protein
MAKSGSGDNWWKVFLIVGGVGLLLYGLNIATAEEKGGGPVPADPGGRINKVVELLNNKFGHRLVTLGLSVLRAYVAKMLPPSEVELVNVVYEVENQPRILPLPGPSKQQLAIQMARQRRLIA